MPHAIMQNKIMIDKKLHEVTIKITQDCAR